MKKPIDYWDFWNYMETVFPSSNNYYLHKDTLTKAIDEGFAVSIANVRPTPNLKELAFVSVLLYFLAKDTDAKVPYNVNMDEAFKHFIVAIVGKPHFQVACALVGTLPTLPDMLIPVKDTVKTMFKNTSDNNMLYYKTVADVFIGQNNDFSNEVVDYVNSR